MSAGLGDDVVLLKGTGNGPPLLKPILINGNAGRDRITFDGSLVSRFAATASADGGTENDILTAAAITGTGSFLVSFVGAAGNDTLTGGDGDDSLSGGTGDDVIHGCNGNDSLFGQDGIDSLTGGLGNDSLDGGANFDTLVEIGDVNVTLTTTALQGLGTDILVGIESALLTGGTRANRLDASAFRGQVKLNGGAGNDTLIGGAFNDELVGGAGADLLDGGSGHIDTIRFELLDTVLGDPFDLLIQVAIESQPTTNEFPMRHGMESHATRTRFGWFVARAKCPNCTWSESGITFPHNSLVRIRSS